MHAPPPPPTTAPPAASLPEAQPSLWQRLRRLTPYFSGQRWAWGLALFATLLGAATEPLMPALLKPLLDSGFTQGTLPLWTVPVFLIGIFVIRGFAQFTGQYALARITNDGMLGLRRSLFERLLAADMGLFNKQSASALSNTVVYEVQTGAQQLVQAMMAISRDGFTLVALLGYLIYLNWQLTLIVAVKAGHEGIKKNPDRPSRLSRPATGAQALGVREHGTGLPRHGARVCAASPP